MASVPFSHAVPETSAALNEISASEDGAIEGFSSCVLATCGGYEHSEGCGLAGEFSSGLLLGGGWLPSFWMAERPLRDPCLQTRKQKAHKT